MYLLILEQCGMDGCGSGAVLQLRIFAINYVLSMLVFLLVGLGFGDPHLIIHLP